MGYPNKMMVNPQHDELRRKWQQITHSVPSIVAAVVNAKMPAWTPDAMVFEYADPPSPARRRYSEHMRRVRVDEARRHTEQMVQEVSAEATPNILGRTVDLGDRTLPPHLQCLPMAHNDPDAADRIRRWLARL